jgi:hypothetical protein
MIHRGIATFTLDGGHCPPWLFERMKRLGGQIIEAAIIEFGADEVVRRMGDPVWFQSLGSVIGFDWNASGLTTVMTAALKEAVSGREEELGFAIAGGKGKTSRKTPQDIIERSELLALPASTADTLVYNSKMSAKVDSALLQDGFELYHHTFFFSRSGAWTVVQQGMNTEFRAARRYHWHSAEIKDLVVDPHSGIASSAKTPTLNLAARESVPTQKISTELVQGSLASLTKDIELLAKHSSELTRMVKVRRGEETLTLMDMHRGEFHKHPVKTEEFSKSSYLAKIFAKLTDEKPRTYESLVGTPGVGGKTLRALALVSEVIYGAAPSYTDPARYSFAHGGKDGTPHPVHTATYDATIEFFRTVIPKIKATPAEKERMVAHLPIPFRAG